MSASPETDPRADVPDLSGEKPGSTPPVFVVCKAEDGLHADVFALHEQLFRSHIEQIWGWHEDWQQENFSSNWRSCDTRVIRVRDELAGYVQTIVQPDHLLLKNLGLLPPHQNLGIGTALVESLKDEASALGLPLKLSVFVTNPGAQRFYQRAGFRCLERGDEFQPMIWESPKKREDADTTAPP